MKRILAIVGAIVLGASPALAQSFPDYINGRQAFSAASPPTFLPTDMIGLVRGNTTYKVPATSFSGGGGTTSITIGTTPITSGTTGRVLYDNGALVGELTAAQLTATVDPCTPTLAGTAPTPPNDVTKFLNGQCGWTTPAGGAANPAGSPGDFQINSAGIFGAFTPGTGIQTFLTTPTSANLRAAITDETGTGAAVFGTSPTITTGLNVNMSATQGNLSARLDATYNQLSFNTANTIYVEGGGTPDNNMYIAAPTGIVLLPSTGSYNFAATTVTTTTDNAASLGSASKRWQTVHSFGLNLYGSSSGNVLLKTPAAAGSNTLTFPAGTTDFSATGGASQVVKQASSGAAFTVARLACADLSDAGAGCTGGGGGSFANPTATASDVAVNGVASTAMRSDAAPAVQKGTNSVFGVVKGDASTINCVAGVCTAVGGAATTITPGTTTVSGATAPCLIDNSATTVMGCAPVGTGVLTALSTAVGSAGAVVVNGGALGTPSSGTGTNITGIPNNNVLAATLATGTSVSLTAPREYYVCTGTCTVTPPVPAAGYEFCVMNDDNVATVITLAALGSSARYEATARTSYGTAGTGTLVSGGAAGDKVCIVGRDSTHYLTAAFNGTWTAN